MIFENILLALSALKSNKMRSLLTMLGIIIGIMSIITIVVIGDAMTSSVTDSLSSLGTNNMTVSLQERSASSSNTFSSFGGGMVMTFSSGPSRTGNTPTDKDMISLDMIDKLKESFPDEIIGVSIDYSAGQSTAKDGDLYANVSVTGVNEDYTLTDNTELLYGRFITRADLDKNAQVCVVSDKFVNNMFPDNPNPVGEQVKIYNQRSIDLYTIVGVYKYESNGFSGYSSEADMRTSFYIPVTTAKKDLIEKNYTSMTVVGAGSIDVNEFTDTLQFYFDRQYYKNEIWSINVSNMSSMLDTVSETIGTISLAIALIAGISLLVGGIGVMNIMLVSVTERTREIGTRKALGAKNFHIQLQFVTEAIIISVVGGLIGLVLGGIIGSVASSLMGATPAISPVVSLGSVAFSVAIGVFFGLYPANKAAKLNPIDALRYE